MRRRFLLFAFPLISLLAIAAPERVTPPKPIDPVEAAKQGRELVGEILGQTPTKNFTNTGVLKIRDSQGKQTELDVNFNIIVSPTNWSSSYYHDTSARSERVMHFGTLLFTTVHQVGETNNYSIREDSEYGWKGGSNPVHGGDEHKISATDLAKPFAGSDFWLCDLGLEFFHWPDQKLLKSELRRTRLCKVLESVNPQPATNAYSRVVSWIDTETLGIVHADAYDFQGKLLKEFDSKKFTKVNGAWQLEEMEMNNVQTGSSTQIKFKFDR